MHDIPNRIAVSSAPAGAIQTPRDIGDTGKVVDASGSRASSFP
jgi:hypothetical protein